MIGGSYFHYSRIKEKRDMAKKKAKAAKAKGSGKCWCEGLPSLVVTSKAKAYVKSKGMMSSSEMVDALSCKLYCILQSATARAQANRRSTVKPVDL
jgi:hypothetical protein